MVVALQDLETDKENVPMDMESDAVDLRQQLESTKDAKLLPTILSHYKEFAKLVSFPDARVLFQRVTKYCEKCQKSDEKREKLVHKLQQFSSNQELFKTFLKYGMKYSKNGENGSILISILAAIVSFQESTSPILGIQMILSHSKAEEIFLEFHKIKVQQNNPLSSEEKNTEKLELSNIKTELLKLWLVLVKSFCKISKAQGTPEDKKILENSVPYLMQMYSATLNPSDLQIYQILKFYSSKKLRIELESLPLFGPKCFDASLAKANPLYAHSIRANAVLGLINDVKAFETGMKFEEEKFLNPEEQFGEDGENFYDLRFLLPLVAHVLDEKNICDVVKIISNGWIYFIARGMSLEDGALRNAAFLAYKRLIFNMHLAKGFRLQDVKIWLHFLLGVKSGFVDLPDCKLPPLLSTWMVATCQVLRSPIHQLYSKVTHFLLAKPKIDLTILPDFTHFFNAEDGAKESREWMLSILLQGLKSKTDWAIAKKVPTIKYMCCLFPLEKIGVQRTILKILAAGAAIPEVAHDLVDRHGILLWIGNMTLEEGKTMYRRELEDIYKNLSRACPYGEFRESIFQFVAKKQGWEYIRVKSEEL